MKKRIGKQTVRFDKKVYIKGSAAICGTKENEGPIGNDFDIIMPDAEWNEETWEKTESKMQREAVKLAVQKAGLNLSDIEYIFAGDLLNQCIGAGFGLRELDIPFFGVYGACSTMIQKLYRATVFVYINKSFKF